MTIPSNALNHPVITEITGTTITDTYTEAVDLGKVYTYKHIMIDSRVDVDILIAFGEVTPANPIPAVAGEIPVLDGFEHNGKIWIKTATATAATTGFVRLFSW
ncbi:hypothetical protein AMJ80_09090 [bacterium SM23_31]|nr:MAG: hypothetical protein AMJ80_09090 [bacterium SM23_31]